MSIWHSFTYSFIQCLFIFPRTLWVGFPGDSVVNNLPTVQELQETQIWSLGLEYPLEKGMAPHFSILAWRIPWTEEPGGLQSMRLQRVRHNRTSLALLWESGRRKKELNLWNLQGLRDPRLKISRSSVPLTPEKECTIMWKTWELVHKINVSKSVREINSPTKAGN